LTDIKPEALNFHYDFGGQFKGLAFVNYKTSKETSRVIKLLKENEIGGRKLKVEYKKKEQKNSKKGIFI